MKNHKFLFLEIFLAGILLCSVVSASESSWVFKMPNGLPGGQISVYYRCFCGCPMWPKESSLSCADSRTLKITGKAECGKPITTFFGCGCLGSVLGTEFKYPSSTQDCGTNTPPIKICSGNDINITYYARGCANNACYNNFINQKSETCPYGCNETSKTCIAQPPTCTPGWQCEVSINATHYQNADCSFSNATNCSNGCNATSGLCIEPSCVDNDGGQNYTVFGTTCVGTDCLNDICSGATLTEYYCQSNSRLSESYNCPEGCKDGACALRSSCVATFNYNAGPPTTADWLCNDSTSMSMQGFDGEPYDMMYAEAAQACQSGHCVPECTDSDNGLNYTVKGFATALDADGFITRIDDLCINTNFVNESYCENNISKYVASNCPNICEDGVCVVCSDSDGGQNYNLMGQTCVGTNCMDDNCSGNILTEYYCQSNISRGSEPYVCPIGDSCDHGACIFTDCGVAIFNFYPGSPPNADWVCNDSTTMSMGGWDGATEAEMLAEAETACCSIQLPAPLPKCNFFCRLKKLLTGKIVEEPIARIASGGAGCNDCVGFAWGNTWYYGKNEIAQLKDQNCVNLDPRFLCLSSRGKFYDCGWRTPQTPFTSENAWTTEVQNGQRVWGQTSEWFCTTFYQGVDGPWFKATDYPNGMRIFYSDNGVYDLIADGTYWYWCDANNDGEGSPNERRLLNNEIRFISGHQFVCYKYSAGGVNYESIGECCGTSLSNCKSSSSGSGRRLIAGQSAGGNICMADATFCTPSAEVCDGKDNDCNSSTPDGSSEASTHLCSKQEGVCAGSVMTCGGALGWQACTTANYGSNYQAVETNCSDGLDNDCNGLIDAQDSSCNKSTITQTNQTCNALSAVPNYYSKGWACVNGVCTNDTCSGNTILEQRCSNTNTLDVVPWNCTYGCNNGACNLAPQTCTAGYVCNTNNANLRHWQNANCSVGHDENCPGCSNGICAGAPAPSTQNYTLEDDFASYSEFEETEVTVGKGIVFSFEIQRTKTISEEHKITVKSVNSTAKKVVLTISSTPFNVNFSAIGQRKQIDANKDGFNDINVTLEGFAGEDAILSFKKLAACGNGICEKTESSAACCKDCQCASGQKCELNKCAAPAPPFSKIAVFIILPIVIVAIIIASFFIMRKLIRDAEERAIARVKFRRKKRK